MSVFFTGILIKGPRSKILAQSLYFSQTLLQPINSFCADRRKIKPTFSQVFSLVTPAGVAAGIAASSSSFSSSSGAGLAAVGLLQGERNTCYVQCGGKGGGGRQYL